MHTFKNIQSSSLSKQSKTVSQSEVTKIETNNSTVSRNESDEIGFMNPGWILNRMSGLELR